MPWDAAASRELGIAWLERALEPAGHLGRIAARRARPFGPGEETDAVRRIARVARLADALDENAFRALRRVVAALPDCAGALAVARSGAPPSDADLFELVRFVRGAADLAALVARERAFDDAPLFDERSETAIAAVARALGPQARASDGFYLDDAFDPSLARCRDEAERARETYALARSRAAARVAHALGRTSLPGTEFVVMRDELPPAGLDGVRVVAEGATYVVCELALDESALAALAASEAAETAVATAEEAVRLRLGTLAAEHARELDDAGARAGEFDLLLASVAFARAHAGCVPELIAESELSLEDARYLPIEESLAAQGRAYVPISLSMRGTAAITGPNMGGKSVALRTCGFAFACAAFGVPIPARAARLPLARTILWLGSNASVDAETSAVLSAFGREIVDARAALATASRATFVLLDEFARTTAPREGRALLAALLQALRARGALALAATHFDGIAEASGAEHFEIAGLREPLHAFGAPDATALDLDAALRRVAHAMDYRLVRVEGAGNVRSGALDLAQALGLDGDVVARARALLAER